VLVVMADPAEWRAGMADAEDFKTVKPLKRGMIGFFP
jgi:hypothetical protein